jgi:hypothetical protein
MTARVHHLRIRALDLTPREYFALAGLSREARPPRHGRTVVRHAGRGRVARFARQTSVVAAGALGVAVVLLALGAPLWTAAGFAILAFAPLVRAYGRAKHELAFERPDLSELLAA